MQGLIIVIIIRAFMFIEYRLEVRLIFVWSRMQTARFGRRLFIMLSNPARETNAPAWSTLLYTICIYIFKNVYIKMVHAHNVP